MRLSRSILVIGSSALVVAAALIVRAAAVTQPGPLYVYDSADSYAIRGSATSSVSNAIVGTSLNGFGVLGSTKNINAYGVLGANTNSGEGVEGTSSSVGVYGSSGGIGVKGTTTNMYIAVLGDASAGTNGGVGVDGFGHVGIVGGGDSAQGGSVGVLGQSGGAKGVALGAVTQGNGPLEILAHNLVTSQDVMSLDQNGNLILRGTLTQNGSPALIFQGKDAKRVAYAPESTAPAIEDTGEGRIVSGAGFVAIDAALAATIDLRKPYQVLVTPKGDCRGLYVAVKTPRGFSVRELMGGRSNVAFAYRIVGSPASADAPRLPLYADPLRRLPVRRQPAKR